MKIQFCGMTLGEAEDWECCDDHLYQYWNFVPAKELWDDPTPRTMAINQETGVIEFYDEEGIVKTIKLKAAVSDE
jgi:hypothetical protein